MSYRRWYDVDPRLSAVVSAMKDLNRSHQSHFAQKFYALSQELLTEYGGEVYLEELDPKKKEGLLKSKSKSRWYDDHESLHMAFNNLYALPTQGRRDLAVKMETPIQIVTAYERYCASQRISPETRVIEEIIRSSFLQGPQRARKLYELYLSPPTIPALHPEVTESLWAQMLKRVQEALTP